MSDKIIMLKTKNLLRICATELANLSNILDDLTFV